MWIKWFFCISRFGLFNINFIEDLLILNVKNEMVKKKEKCFWDCNLFLLVSYIWFFYKIVFNIYDDDILFVVLFLFILFKFYVIIVL